MLAAVGALREQVVEYSSLLPPQERAASLARFKAGAWRACVRAW